MSQQKHQQEEVNQNLVAEIKIYIKNKDLESLEYLLEDQEQQKLSKIKSKLTQNEKTYFQEIIQKLNKSKPCKQTQISNRGTQRAYIQTKQEQQSEENPLQNYEKQFKISDIQYGQHFSYPFLGLLQKMSKIYFPVTHPNPFPDTSLKMLHSLIQTLFTYIFDDKIKQTYNKKKSKQKGKFINYLKQYFFHLFEQQYQRFIRFTKIYKSIKTSTSKKQQTQVDIQQKLDLDQSLTVRNTQRQQQMDYLAKITQQIKKSVDIKQIAKLKSLNFLYFGQKRLRQLIDPENKIFNQTITKEIYQLISFVICRFVRKIILKCIRQKKNGKLEFLQNHQQIQSIDVKIVGNKFIDLYKQKIQSFVKVDQTLQEIAKRTFLQEFYQYQYEQIIPKAVQQDALKELSINKQSKMTFSQLLWNKNRKYQCLWLQRIKAQQQIGQRKQQKNMKNQRGKINNYYKFIQNHMEQFEQNRAMVWINYFTMNYKVSQQQDYSKKFIQEFNQNSNLNTGPKTRKKLKLQSLSN